MSIPKIIHCCWLSGESYPELVQKCIESWKRVLPEYEIILWDKKRFDIHSVPWVEQACAEKKWAFAADYIRLYALYNYGGIYLDSDVEVLKPFDSLLNLPYFFGEEYKSDGIDASHIIEAATFGSEAHNLLLKECLDYYSNRNFKIKDNLLDTTVLPHIMAQNICKERTIQKIKSVHDFQIDDGIFCLFPMTFFSPKNTRTQKIEATDETFSIHHFNGSWYSKAQQKHVNARIFLCRHLGEFWGTKFSTLYALCVNVQYNGFKATWVRGLQKLKSIFEAKKWNKEK